jgi:PD-(D/E)XK nuclease superfamily
MSPLNKLHLFATEQYPLHISQIPELMQCDFKSVMKFVEANVRESNCAADTGSAMHKATATWHKNGKEAQAALATMRKLREEYPMADLPEAERLFRLYIADQRNQDAKVVACEHYLTGKIEGCHFAGTTDQIRDFLDDWAIWDVKTSKMPGPKIRDEHTYQICGYAVLATKKFKRPVRPGGIIMARGYDSKGDYDKVMYPYDITVEQAEKRMLSVCRKIEDVRSGRITPTPGDHCGYCIGVRACLQKLDRLTTEGRV